MPHPEHRPCRRQVLCWAGKSLGGLALGMAGCESPGTSSPSPCGTQVGPAAEGWVPLPLADYPTLAQEGGWTPYQNTNALLDVNVACVEEGCYVATWAICPHGACYLTYDYPGRQFVCPCHGSRFGEDGSLLEGPAERGLATFPAAREADTVWVQGQTSGRKL